MLETTPYGTAWYHMVLQTRTPNLSLSVTTFTVHSQPKSVTIFSICCFAKWVFMQGTNTELLITMLGQSITIRIPSGFYIISSEYAHYSPSIEKFTTITFVGGSLICVPLLKRILVRLPFSFSMRSSTNPA